MEFTIKKNKWALAIVARAGEFKFKTRNLGAFQVETVKLNLHAMKTGTFTLKPQLTYINDLGETQTIKVHQVSITIKPAFPKDKAENVSEGGPAELRFESEVAQKAFDFSVKAFVEDYVRRKLPLEKSGWRTSNGIVKNGQVSQYSVYGSPGRRGMALSELERLGVVETRFFMGERGRGGKILKVKVAYENESVRRHIDQRD